MRIPILSGLIVLWLGSLVTLVFWPPLAAGLLFAQRVWSTRSTDHPGRSWLEDVDAAPFTGKAIRMARALRCLKEAIERNCTHSVSEPDSAPPVGERAKYREVQYVNRPRSVIVDGVSFREPEVTGEAWYRLL